MQLQTSSPPKTNQEHNEMGKIGSLTLKLSEMIVADVKQRMELATEKKNLSGIKRIKMKDMPDESRVDIDFKTWSLGK